jgi:hypothetical protein
MITYPTNRLLAVVDRPADARSAVGALVASGVSGGDAEILMGESGRDRLARLGPSPNLLSRAVRAVQFLSMDQAPDFLVYERALLDGRAVVAVRVAGRQPMLAAAAVLERHGGHFLNHFGRLMTEELTLWRGPEPEIPDALRR